jgi:anthranilate phosphoribosyltransferase
MSEILRPIIGKVAKRENLSHDEIKIAMTEIINEKATPAQIGAFLTALSIKGETTDEIKALVEVIYENALKINAPKDAIDIHGTGGDFSDSFNISTASTFVVAAAGAIIAKHGNKSNTGRSGSADAFEALGININLKPNEVEQCINDVGIGFMFAQNFHPKLKPIVNPRKEIGVRTIFNLAFPLVSPANVKNHSLGVATWELAPFYMDVLKKLGCNRIAIIHGCDGMDEISISGPSKILFYDGIKEETIIINPEDFGMETAEMKNIQVKGSEESAATIRKIFEGKINDCRKDIVILNSAVGLLVAGKAISIHDGVEMAKNLIESGKALNKLNELSMLSRCF